MPTFTLRFEFTYHDNTTQSCVVTTAPHLSKQDAEREADAFIKRYITGMGESRVSRATCNITEAK